MNVETPPMEQGQPPAPPNKTANDFFRQTNTLAMIAGILMLVGFFMSWVDPTGSLREYSDEMSMPTINGTYLVSAAGGIGSQLPGLLLKLFLLLIPICGAVIAYTRYSNTHKPFRENLWVALAVYLPFSLFFIVLFMSGVEDIRFVRRLFGRNVDYGFGMYMMMIGGIYLTFLVFSEVIRRNKELSQKTLLQHGIIGGAIKAVVIMLLLKLTLNSLDRGDNVGIIVFLLCCVHFLGIWLTTNYHQKSLNGNINHGRVVMLGMIESAAYILSVWILANVFYSNELRWVNGQMNIVITLLLLNGLWTFILSSIVGWIKSETGTPVRKPAEVVN